MAENTEYENSPEAAERARRRRERAEAEEAEDSESGRKTATPRKAEKGKYDATAVGKEVPVDGGRGGFDAPHSRAYARAHNGAFSQAALEADKNLARFRRSEESGEFLRKNGMFKSDFDRVQKYRELQAAKDAAFMESARKGQFEYGGNWMGSRKWEMLGGKGSTALGPGGIDAGQLAATNEWVREIVTGKTASGDQRYGGKFDVNKLPKGLITYDKDGNPMVDTSKITSQEQWSAVQSMMRTDNAGQGKWKAEQKQRDAQALQSADRYLAKNGWTADQIRNTSEGARRAAARGLQLGTAGGAIESYQNGDIDEKTLRGAMSAAGLSTTAQDTVVHGDQEQKDSVMDLTQQAADVTGRNKEMTAAQVAEETMNTNRFITGWNGTAAVPRATVDSPNPIDFSRPVVPGDNNYGTTAVTSPSLGTDYTEKPPPVPAVGPTVANARDAEEKEAKDAVGEGSVFAHPLLKDTW